MNCNPQLKTIQVFLALDRLCLALSCKSNASIQRRFELCPLHSWELLGGALHWRECSVYNGCNRCFHNKPLLKGSKRCNTPEREV